MPVSIEDVAKRANVSISTVSRVINGRNVVNSKTRHRVESAIEELGYRPNVFARGLMLRRSNLLGLVLPDLHGEFYSEIIRGANLRARELGYHLVVSSASADDDGQSLLALVGDHGLLDGVAVMLSDVTAGVRSLLMSVSSPLVILDGQIDGVTHDSVLIDQLHGATAMMTHLVHSCGYQRVIFVGGLSTNIDTIQRLQAYREVLDDAGVERSSDDEFHLDYSYETAFELGKRWLRDWIRSRACVFAANDEMAAGLVDAAIAEGVCLPDDLGIVGFDDTRVARMMRPRLTTVRVPMSALGAAAVELLCARLEDSDRPPKTVTLQSELIVRESCCRQETAPP